MLRLRAVALTASIVGAGILLAGERLAAQMPRLEAASLEAHSAIAAVPATAAVAPARSGGFGRSGAVRVIVAAPGAEIDLAGVSSGGLSFSSAPQWSSLNAPRHPRVLGEPVAAPAEASYAFASKPSSIVHAPGSPGLWRLDAGDGSTITVLTQVPATEVRSGRLNGYHIGTYPTAGSSRTDVYAPPTAFIEVTPELRDLPISDHLVLGQFLTKDQFDVWPKYVALDLRLIDKLELVIQELNAMGIRAERMHVMSGFRTPQYNGPGGNGRASLSRHMWGDAADVWIDNLGDGQMDDLNGDGRIDMDDAAVIMRAVERVERKYPELIGGAGTYPGTTERGAFIHIDVRGYHSRW